MNETATEPEVSIKPEISIKEVAKVAGVSIATVSRCLNDPESVREATRDKVTKAIVETGYSPNVLAQSFRRGKTNVVMVVLPSIGDPFFTDALKGIRTVARANGYAIMINETQFNTLAADEIGAMMVSRWADGIVLLASLSPYGTEVLSSRSRRAIPIVVGCETISPELARFPSVHIDNVAAAREATDYLVSMGHRRIGFISGEETSLLTLDRERGYRAAMKAAKLAIEAGWVVQGNMNIPGAVKATRSLLNHKHRPTAIFCANDEMAMGAYHEIKSAGLKIPQDISVVGFDDTRYADVMDPPLTTIRQPAEEIGERTLYRLCKAIEGKDEPGDTPEIVPHQLIVRRSVAKPRR